MRILKILVQYSRLDFWLKPGTNLDGLFISPVIPGEASWGPLNLLVRYLIGVLALRRAFQSL